ncbi:MAG: hypothetical protein WB952_24760 [Terriglobales bacterium]
MEIERLEMVYLELKYCERCGGLWFRRKGDAHLYCESCSMQWADAAGAENEASMSYAGLKRAIASDRRIVDFIVLCPQEGEA